MFLYQIVRAGIVGMHIKRQDCIVIERIPGRPQNSTVQGIIWRLDKTAAIITNHWHLWPVTIVKYPCNCYLW